MKTLNKRFYRGAIAALLAASCLVNHAYSATEPLDRIIAIVDDDVVLASEFKQRLEQVQSNLQKAGREVPAEQLQRDLLDQLIVESIQIQMAARAGVRIDDAQLNQAMARVAAQNGLSLEQFRDALESEGRSYVATREQIRKEMMLQRVQQGNVNQRIQISDREINNFLESEEGKALTAPQYHLIHALVPIEPDASTDAIAQARQTADALYQKIQQGGDFEQLAAANVNIQGGDLGWRRANELPNLFASIAPTLSPGQTAAPVESASGFHLVKLLEKRGDGELIAQTHARHILLKPSAIRDDNATEAQLKKLRQKILDGADFSALAKQYSEDIGSAQEGGDLGWTNPGQLVPSFEKAMSDTAMGDISRPFRSEYGWHIVQVLERREKDVTDELRRNIARNYIHKRKFDDELQAWLQKIRDEAYVDIK